MVSGITVRGLFFVGRDSTGVKFDSSAANEFAVRATGGVRFVTGTGPDVGVSLGAGGTAWGVISDRNRKENFEAVDAKEILEKVAAMPMEAWNYKHQDASVRHIGPMAQDFHAAFDLGNDDLSITTQDADGVALAAIQGLNRKLEDRNANLLRMMENKDVQIAALEKQNAAFEARLAALEER